MGMTGFSDAEMALLSGLDAVAWVTRTRITYTDSFKREAIERYRRGESPVRGRRYGAGVHTSGESAGSRVCLAVLRPWANPSTLMEP